MLFGNFKNDAKPVGCSEEKLIEIGGCILTLKASTLLDQPNQERRLLHRGMAKRQAEDPEPLRELFLLLCIFLALIRASFAFLSLKASP